ncbi:MAG TPA: hypothetical protein VM689_11685 [Aliidongia sp.]|nr:hypothetical protein [Aliidongia sp.]
MADAPEALAQSLLDQYGAGALAVAEQAAANVRIVPLDEKATLWARVIEAIKRRRDEN